MESRFTSSLIEFPADGQSSGQLVLSKSGSNPEDAIIGPFPEKGNSITIIKRAVTAKREIIYFKSTTVPGKVSFKSKSGKEIYLTFYKNRSDIDKDGFPDMAELTTQADREAFRNWFVRIAESQFLKRNYAWNRNERDCAGLIRYAYREALKKHDLSWHMKSGIIIDKNLPDVERFHYPNIPFIGDKIFRIVENGPFNSAFSSFADSESLLKYNTAFVSRDMADAKRGDLLFFHNEYNSEYPFHSMIVADNSGREPIVIYHTGTGDIMKRVPLSYLKESSLFYPSSGNRNFLGIYRFLILE